VGWGLFTLVGVPRFFGVPLSFIRYLAPDFGAALVATGMVALGWGIVRTVLMLRVLRTPVAPRPVTVVAKASFIQ
jgi:hypothetical protein